MDPLKVKLTYWEAKEMADYINQAALIANNPQAREELIVLAESYLKFYTQTITNGRRPRGKAYNYTVPVSVARILHRRWQLETITSNLQMCLSGLDYALTQRGLKPNPMKPELF